MSCFPYILVFTFFLFVLLLLKLHFFWEKETLADLIIYNSPIALLKC